MTSAMSRLPLVLFLIAPVACHRLIVGPQIETAWDSVIVSSDPIKITEGKRNDSASAREPDFAIRLHKNRFDEKNRIGKECKYSDISCLYGTEAPEIESHKSDNQDIIDRFLEQYSSITNVKFGNGDSPNATEMEVKSSYWGAERPNQPLDDKKNWVTLDTVPWSTSTVSKWKPNLTQTAQVQHQQSESHNGYDNNNNYQHHHTPADKPWNYGAIPSVNPTVQGWTSGRPSVTTNYGSYTPVSNHQPPPQPSPWGTGNEIITDERPSNFPLGNGGYNGLSSLHIASVPTHSRIPAYIDTPPTALHHSQNSQQGMEPYRYPSVVRHPSTHPDTGDGEWVLLSTTKGYSLPTGYRGPGKGFDDREAKGRQEISKYHEERIDVPESKPSKRLNRRWDFGNDENVDKTWGNDKLNEGGLSMLHTGNGNTIYTAPKHGDRHGKADWSMEDSPLQILYSSNDENEKVPSVTLKRRVRLQVLPHVSNVTTLSHNGLLEVDSNTQTVDEEHKAIEDEKIKELSKIAKVRRSNFTLYRVVPAPLNHAHGKSYKDKSAAVLAAVGAGMIPATMAVLVPMALGRKKRSLTSQRFTSKLADAQKIVPVSGFN